MTRRDDFNENVVNRLGKIVLQYRTMRGHTAKEVAERLGITPAQMCWLEKGQKGVTASASLFRRAADYTGIPVGILFYTAMGDLSLEDLALVEVNSLVREQKYRTMLNFVYAAMTAMPLWQVKEMEVMCVRYIMSSPRAFEEMPESIRHYVSQRAITRAKINKDLDKSLIDIFEGGLMASWSKLLSEDAVELQKEEPAPPPKTAKSIVRKRKVS